MDQVSTENKNQNSYTNHKDEEEVLKKRTEKKITAPKTKKQLRQKIDWRNFQSDEEED